MMPSAFNLKRFAFSMKCKTHIPAKLFQPSLLATLRYLSSGAHFQVLEDIFRISNSTLSKMIPEIYNAILNCLARDYHSASSQQRSGKKADGFIERWNYPRGLGAIDGKHIQVLWEFWFNLLELPTYLFHCPTGHGWCRLAPFVSWYQNRGSLQWCWVIWPVFFLDSIILWRVTMSYSSPKWSSWGAVPSSWRKCYSLTESMKKPFLQKSLEPKEWIFN